MQKVKNEIIQYKSEKKIIKSTPRYAPAGQSTQMIIGATGESDRDIMYSANYYYKQFNMRRVYYSGYIPVLSDNRLPAIGTEVPILRENRLYQTDWLLRFYGFSINEILNDSYKNLDLQIDPKLSWALRNFQLFPIDINHADKRMLARIPGVGMQSVYKIIHARKFRKLDWHHLKAIGIALNRAQYFIICNSKEFFKKDLLPDSIKNKILQNTRSKYQKHFNQQLRLFS